MGVTNCLKIIPVQYFIVVQLIVFLPLALVRDLAKLSSTALIADAFILAGLVYIFGSEINIIAERGVADVQLFNPKDFALFIGYVIYCCIACIFNAFPERLSSLLKALVWYVPSPLFSSCAYRAIGYPHHGCHG